MFTWASGGDAEEWTRVETPRPSAAQGAGAGAGAGSGAKFSTKAAQAPKSAAKTAAGAGASSAAGAGGGGGGPVAPPELTGPATTKLYFEDTWCFELAEAVVLDVVQMPTKQGSTPAVVLDRTIFHPQGGGQPSDVGTIISADGATTFHVELAKCDGPTGVITHAGTFGGDGAAAFAAGDKVALRIDADKRRLHARIHSAGHALDVALAQVAEGGNDVARGLVPTKGYHFPDGPTVEYEGKVPADARDALVAALQEALDKVIAADVATTAKEVPATEVNPMYLSTGFPMDQTVRVVGVAGNLLCPCGGTHVKRSGELGVVKVNKVKTKKNATKLYYSVQ